MKKFTQKITLAAVALITMLPLLKADHLSNRLTFSARLTPYPGVTSTGHGVAAFMTNSTWDTLFFTISSSSLTSPINGFHIHNARTGANIVVDFDGKILRNTVRSYLTGSQLATLWPDFIAGNLYVAVHTTTNPAVEIYGFVKLESDWGFAASLDGTQASSGSNAVGHASINFSMKGDTAIVRASFNGLNSKVTGAHLHWGKMGQSGGVALHLEDLIRTDSSSLFGGVMVTPTEWTGLMAALMADSIYLNIHTMTSPNGEIRGQVRSSKDLRFNAYFSQGQLPGTPGKVSNGFGAATLRLNAMMDTLWFEGVFQNMTSTVTAAHFHNAETTANGPVVKGIDNTLMNGKMFKGMWTKMDATAPLTANMISELLMGNLYFALHTDSIPGGEVRANIFRVAREGFIAELDGMQQVPTAVTTMALGTGIVSYDRDRTNLHCMIAFENVGSAASAMHIHKNVKGQNGGVVLDFGMPTSNGYYGYMKINNAFSLPLRQGDSCYINVHTANNPNGEIRGQLWRSYRISSPTVTPVGVSETSLNAQNLSVYPNPATDNVSVNFNANSTGSATVLITDLQGKTLVQKVVAVAKGDNLVTLPVNSLDNGIYFLQIETAGSKAVSKLVKN